MNADEILARQIGMLTMQIASLQAERATLLAERESTAKTVTASFELLDQCIRSEQVPHEDIPKLVANVPGFAQWQAKQRKG